MILTISMLLATFFLQFVHSRQLLRPSGPGYTSVMVVPTGIGASIGGFAGDALPSARLLSSCVDTLITHPNVLNGAMMYWPLENTLYVEGYALDEFAGERIGLVPTNKRSNVIGLLLDKGIEESLRIRHLQAADAARATLGINVAKCIVTSKEVGVETSVSDTGASWGSVKNIDTLVDGARKLVEEGCTAIAVIARFPEEDDGTEGASGYDAALFESYRKGEGVDAIAGVEALISHTITKHLGVPCAHAPAFSPETEPFPDTAPKAAAEELGYTFLPCVLANLHRAPQLVPLKHEEGAALGMTFEAPDILRAHTGPEKPFGPGHGEIVVTASDVDSVIVPHTALGGSAVLSLLARGTLVVTVRDNESAMDVSADKLLGNSGSIAHGREWGRVIEARSYTEAAGIVMAHRHGILLEALGSTLRPLSADLY